MKRKVYMADHERREGQLHGIIAFPLVNVPLGLIVNHLLMWARDTYAGAPDYAPIATRILLLPWFVNGVVLTLMFFFSPEMGAGYIMSIFVIMFAAIVLSALFLASCISSLIVGPLFVVLFPILFFGGLIKLARWASDIFEEWRWPDDY